MKCQVDPKESISIENGLPMDDTLLLPILFATGMVLVNGSNAFIISGRTNESRWCLAGKPLVITIGMIYNFDINRNFFMITTKVFGRVKNGYEQYD